MAGIIEYVELEMRTIAQRPFSEADRRSGIFCARNALKRCSATCATRRKTGAC